MKTQLSLFVAVFAVGVLACEGDRQSAIGPQFATGASGKAPRVTAANPNYGLAGDLDDAVTITGSGFTAGATVAWERGGVIDPKVKVLSSTVVNSTTINARVSIAPDANIALYDISVLLADGKKGIGTELYAVKPTSNSQPDTTSIWDFETVMSDGVTATKITGDGGSYENAVCGVVARLYVEQGASASGDALLAPDVSWHKSDRCTRRVIKLDLSTGTLYNTTWVNAKHIGFMPSVGDQQDQAMRWVTNVPNCDDIVFGDAYPDALTPGVTVTRLPDLNGRRVWNVESKPPHTARCRSNQVFTGVSYSLPFRVRITQGAR